MEEVFQRLKEFIAYMKLSNRAFCMSIGVNPSTFGNYNSNTRTPGYLDLYLKVLNTYRNISAEWLFRGEGDMIRKVEAKELSESQIIDMLNKLIEENMRLSNENGRLNAQLDNLAKLRQNKKRLSLLLSSSNVAEDNTVIYTSEKKEIDKNR